MAGPYGKPRFYAKILDSRPWELKDNNNFDFGSGDKKFTGFANFTY